MYLFVRSLRLNGTDMRGAMNWVTTITEHVNQVTAAGVNAWNRVYSQGVGSIAFVAPFADHTALEGFNDKLMVDDRYLDLVGEGQKYIIEGSVDDHLSMLVHPAEASASPPSGEYAVVVETTCANGRLAEGLSVGVEIAQRATELTGIPTMFQIDDGGNFGAVSWVTLYPNAAEMERAGQMQFGDAGFIELVDQKAGRVYTDVPGASTQMTYRRFA